MSWRNREGYSDPTAGEAIGNVTREERMRKRRIRQEESIFAGREYQSLANGIIEQAAKDYRTALRTIRSHPDSETAQRRVKEIEHFFRSKWFSQLTQLDPDYLIKRLRKENVK